MPLPFSSKRSDDANPPWSAADRDASRGEPEQLGPARSASKQTAQSVLAEVYEATRGLGDALNRTGFGPDRWGTPEARLSTLSDRLPRVTLEALLARLADFALDAGPAWLASTDVTGAAIDEFAHEVHVLAAAVDPLHGVAGRAHTIATAATSGRRSLELALKDGRVRTQLERLSDALRQLLVLVPLLGPSSPSTMSREAGAALATLSSDALLPRQDDASAVPGWLFEQPAQEQASHVQPGVSKGAWKGIVWPGSQLLRAGWSRRRVRAWLGLGLVVAALLVLALTATFAILHGLPAAHPETAVLGRAVATATTTGSRSATPSVARTSTAGAPTQAPAAASARLAVSPGSVVLPCKGTSMTLTVSDTGQQALNWQASVSGNASLSATSGTVGPMSQATLSVHATGAQHGPGAIVFTSDGGKATVTFKVSCH
jgi:hypothetical protein